MKPEHFISDILLPSEEDPDLFDPNCDPENPRVLTYEEVKAAKERIKDGIICTPCKKSHLSYKYNMEIYFKEEFLQVTGSFKERGARNALLQLTHDEAKRGVIACSAGNHALGLAYHGKLLNIPVTVIMPVNASVMKRELCQSYGGRVLLKGGNMSESKRYALKLAKMNNLPLINGYDHPHILAGQGSVGMEILEQVPDVDAIIVPVGGGGLIAGISVAAKSVRPNIIIIGVESENCPGFKQAMVAGKPVYTDIAPSCADGLAISMVGVNAFKTSHKLVDKAITLNESYMHRAVLHLLEAEKCVVECSGVTPLAAIMAEMLPDLIGKKVVCVLSGGNIDTPMLCRIIQNALALEGRLCRFAVVLTDGPGSIADLCLILKDVGVSIKDITQDRIWVKSSVFQVQVKCVCETNSISQTADLERALKAKYKHVVWAEDAVW